MHMAPALFQRANAGRHVTGDEGTSHHVSGVIKTCRGEISRGRTTWADIGPLHGWQNDYNIWRQRERGLLGVNKHKFSIYCMMRIHLWSPGVTNKRFGCVCSRSV